MAPGTWRDPHAFVAAPGPVAGLRLQRFAQDFECEVVVSRRTERSVHQHWEKASRSSIRRHRGVRRGDEFDALHYHFDMYRSGGPVFDRPAFGGLEKLSAETCSLCSRPDRQHTEIAILAGSLESNAAERHVVPSCG